MKSILALPLAGVLLAFPAFHARAPSVRHTGAAAVRVVVEGEGGAFEPGHGCPDFAITIDGHWRRTSSCAVDDRPVNILLVLDASVSAISRAFALNPDPAHSWTKPFAAVVNKQFVGHLSTADRLRVASFGKRLTMSPRFTNDRREQTNAVSAVVNLKSEDEFWGSPIWDLVGDAVGTASTEAEPRAIVLFTDGESTFASRTALDVARKAAADRTAIHVVSAAFDRLVRQDPQTAIRVHPRTDLRRLADLSGGIFLEPPGADREYVLTMRFFRKFFSTPGVEPEPLWDPDPGRAFARIAASLHQAYIVGFDASDLPEGAHILAVTTNRPTLRVHAPVEFAVP